MLLILRLMLLLLLLLLFLLEMLLLALLQLLCDGFHEVRHESVHSVLPATTGQLLNGGSPTQPSHQDQSEVHSDSCRATTGQLVKVMRGWYAMGNTHA